MSIIKFRSCDYNLCFYNTDEHLGIDVYKIRKKDLKILSQKYGINDFDKNKRHICFSCVDKINADFNKVNILKISSNNKLYVI